MAGKLSSLEFACAVANLRLTPDALAATRRVLVYGERQAAVGVDIGSSKSTINYWVSRVTDAHAKQMHAMAATVPADWSAALIALPVDQMQKVKAQAVVAEATLRAKAMENG